jgi:hypothetical protein
MSLTLPLTPAEEEKLRTKARAEGTTPEQMVRQAIEPILASVPDEVSTTPRTKPPADGDRMIDEIFDAVEVPPGVGEGALRRENWYR